MKSLLRFLMIIVLLSACASALLALHTFVDASLNLRLSKDPRTLASTTGMIGALFLSGLGALSALLVAVAIAHHTEMVRDGANRTLLNQAANIQVTDMNWKRLVEQVAADVLHEQITIVSFSDLDAGSVAWIRFVIGSDSSHGRSHANRVLVFATGRRVVGCKGWGRAIHQAHWPQAVGELHAIWNHFAGQSEQPSSLPRDCTWFVLPLQAPQDQKRVGVQAQFESFLRKANLTLLRK